MVQKVTILNRKNIDILILKCYYFDKVIAITLEILVISVLPVI